MLHLTGSKNITISGENNGNDIKRFAESGVCDLIFKNPYLRGKISRELESKIVENLTNRAQGMFRWVSMSLETLQSVNHINDLDGALAKLPTALHDLYTMIYAEICQTGTHERDIVIKTLKWLLCAQRLLSVNEVLAALNEPDIELPSDPDDLSRNEQVLAAEDVVLGLCRNLVILDSVNGVFRFAHQSVQEWLLDQPEFTILEQHTVAAERSLDIYLAESRPGSITSEAAQENSILKSYARLYWPVHFKYVEKNQSTNLKRKISRFFAQDSKAPVSYLPWASERFITRDSNKTTSPYLQWTSEMYKHKWSDSEQSLESVRFEHRLIDASSKPETYLNAACAFGFPSLMREYGFSSADCNLRQAIRSFGESTIDPEISRPSTHLIIAASHGHYEVVRILLEKGVDINARDGSQTWDCVEEARRLNALQKASENGHNQVVKLLLEKGAKVHGRCPVHSSPLTLASERGHMDVVQTLLHAGVAFNTPEGLHKTPLHIAACYGHVSVVQALLDRGANVDGHCGYLGLGSTPLVEASMGGHTEVVSKLLNGGADIEARPKALDCAVIFGKYEVARLLLRKKPRGSALNLAAYEGRKETVKFLLDNGADVNAEDQEFSALYLAVDRGHDEVVRLLLEKGANINARGGHGSIGKALDLAANKGYEKVVQLLLDNGADVNPEDDPYSALWKAVYRGHDKVVRLLLDKGASINANARPLGRTFLRAAFRGYKDIVQLLLDNGADIDAKSWCGENALWIAMDEGHEEVVQTLLDAGAEKCGPEPKYCENGPQPRRGLLHCPEMPRWEIIQAFEYSLCSDHFTRSKTVRYGTIALINIASVAVIGAVIGDAASKILR